MWWLIDDYVQKVPFSRNNYMLGRVDYFSEEATVLVSESFNRLIIQNCLSKPEWETAAQCQFSHCPW